MFVDNFLLVPSQDFWLVVKEKPKTFCLHSLANFLVVMLVLEGAVQNDLEGNLIVPDCTTLKATGLLSCL